MPQPSDTIAKHIAAQLQVLSSTSWLVIIFLGIYLYLYLHIYVRMYGMYLFNFVYFIYKYV